MAENDLKGLNLYELEDCLKLPKFRAKQIYHWIHQKHVVSFDEMANLPLDVRKELKENFYISSPKVLKKQRSKDGTIKYLLELEDGELIESVYLKGGEGRFTVCVSSQSGCSLGCKFCATSKMGFKRNLLPGEILSQVYMMPKVNNVVFMGMGEPFLNYENVLKAVYILNSKEGINLGARKITISTSGIVEGIKKLADEKIQVRLAVSLNSAVEELRSTLMPVNQKYPLSELWEAILSYQRKTNRRITLEYILLGGINDSDKDLSALVMFCKGLDVNINLIPYNFYGGEFKVSSKEKSSHFIEKLKSKGIESVLRVSRGNDIAAACGQLVAFNPRG